jgi:hypothetical protein
VGLQLECPNHSVQADMSVYFVTGKLGNGKTLSAVGKIRDYMGQGRRVATNLDICPDRLLPHSNTQPITRLPDKPRIQDLEALGTGDGKSLDDYDESTFGLLVLDELGSWFNSRAWNDKGRADLIEWFLHARKYHWDIIFLVQDIDAVDKQLRGSLCEHLVCCARLDKLTIPFISPITKLLFGKPLHFPKMHTARVYYGDSERGLKVDRWNYLGRDLYAGYRTGQVFTSGQQLLSGELVDMRASYSILSAWHTRGRYRIRRSLSDYLFTALGLPLLVIALVALMLDGLASGRSPDASAAKLKLPKRPPANGNSLASCYSRALDVYGKRRFVTV